MSLRSRLLLALGVVAIAALVAADVATYSALRSFLLDRVDQGLQSSHVEIEQCLTNGCQQGFGPGPPSAGHGSAPTRLDPGTFLEVRYPSGQPYVQDAYQFPSNTPLSPKLPADHHWIFEKRGPGWRADRLFHRPRRPEGRSAVSGASLGTLQR